MMAFQNPHAGGMQHPGIAHGQQMGPGQVPHPGQQMGQQMQMHPGASAPGGPQAGPMMAGMQPGMGPGGPSAHAMSHLTPGGQMMQQQNMPQTCE